MMYVAPGLSEADHAPALVGFIVPKSVGNAVTRNRVERRLRHLMRPRVKHLADRNCVIRVFPPAATATSDQLGEDLDRALESVLLRISEECGGDA